MAAVATAAMLAATTTMVATRESTEAADSIMKAP
jgi:hypothetical protein